MLSRDEATNLRDVFRHEMARRHRERPRRWLGSQRTVDGEQERARPYDSDPAAGFPGGANRIGRDARQAGKTVGYRQIARIGGASERGSPRNGARGHTPTAGTPRARPGASPASGRHGAPYVAACPVISRARSDAAGASQLLRWARRAAPARGATPGCVPGCAWAKGCD